MQPVARSDWHSTANLFQGVLGAVALGTAVFLTGGFALGFLGAVVLADAAADQFTGRGFNGWFAKWTGWGDPNAGSVSGMVADALAPRAPQGVSYRQPYAPLPPR